MTKANYTMKNASNDDGKKAKKKKKKKKKKKNPPSIFQRPILCMVSWKKNLKTWQSIYITYDNMIAKKIKILKNQKPSQTCIK